MNFSVTDFEALLPAYLSGDLSDSDKASIDLWRAGSPENEQHFQNSLKAWESISLLQEMEQFNSFEALSKVHDKIAHSGASRWLNVIKLVAAIFLLPLMGYSGYVTFQNFSLKKSMAEHIIMQTISSRQGMVSQFLLADGTKVWLNSGSELQFPTRFAGDKREVMLKGEAFFEVTKDKKQPFRVNANDLKIDVLGTSFDVISYSDDCNSEVILAKGKVDLSSENGEIKKQYGLLKAGERAIYEKTKKSINIQSVDVDKYISWREGSLIFRDDCMKDVVDRLSRWFNVEIIVNDPEINKYIYKATFRNENLIQVLNLLKLSAPIDYRITHRSLLSNGEFTKQKIYLMKRKS